MHTKCGLTKSEMADDQLLFCTLLATDLIFMFPKVPQEFVAGTY